MTVPEIIILCILASFLVMIVSCLFMSRNETQKEIKVVRQRKETDKERSK